MLKPWSAGSFGETNDRPLYQGQSDVHGEDATAQIFWWDSVGRFRFDKNDPQPFTLGYRWQTMDLDTNSTRLPDHLDEISLAAGIPITRGDDGQLSAVVGLGYSGDNPFGNSSGYFGIGHVIYRRPMSENDSLIFSLDYNGNASFLPDVPLPGFQFERRAERLSFGVGFPDSWVQWNITRELSLDASYSVPFTASAELAYRFSPRWSAFVDYANWFNAFALDDNPRTDRLFFQMSRVETGVRFQDTVWGIYLDVALAVGYAFEQNVDRGFDVRGLDHFSSVSDVPYVGLVVIGRF